MRLVSWLLLPACAGKGGADSGSFCAEAPVVTWESHGQALLTQWCQPCHGSGAANRHGAPEGVSFDTYEQALTWKERILAVTAADNPTMPPGIDLPEEDRYRLDVWLTCYE